MLEPIDKLFDDPIIVPEIPTLIITDTHCPYQNKQLLMAAFKIAKKRNVRQLIHAGDLIDAAQYNTQAKNESIPPIDIEIEHARSVLYTAKRYFNKIYIMPGNHDHFYTHKMKISFQSFIIDTVLLGKYTTYFNVTEYDYVYYGDFAVVGHTTGYNMLAGKLASELAMKYGKHCFVGHDHIQGCIEAENGKLGISIGAMFMPHRFAYKEKSYTIFPDSMLGFVIIADGKISHFNEQLKETIYEC